MPSSVFRCFKCISVFTLTAAKCRDAVFHTTPTPTVCYSVPSIVEVCGGCQSVNIYVCANEGLL